MAEKRIRLPSDKEAIGILAQNIDASKRTIENPSFLPDIHPKQKEALVLALKRAAACARNIESSLK
jgi:hypothetical protein